MRHPAPLARGSVSKVTLEGSQSQQLPGGINFSRLSPVELLGNLRGDKNIHICRGQAEKRGLRRPGQAGEGPAFRGSRGGAGAAGALSGCPPGVWGVPAPSPPPAPQPSPPEPGFPPRAAPGSRGGGSEGRGAPLFSPPGVPRARRLPGLAGAGLGAGPRDCPAGCRALPRPSRRDPSSQPRSPAPPGANRSAC